MAVEGGRVSGRGYSGPVFRHSDVFGLVVGIGVVGSRGCWDASSACRWPSRGRGVEGSVGRPRERPRPEGWPGPLVLGGGVGLFDLLYLKLRGAHHHSDVARGG